MKKTLIASLMALGAMTQVHAADIVDTAVAAGSFKTLVTAVQAAGLVDTLKGPGPFTVFAPTDAAFAALPAGTVEDLLKPENKDKLVSILTYHVLPAKVMSTDLSEGLKARGLQILLGTTDYDIFEEERLIEQLLRRRPEAIVVTGGQHTPRARRMLENAGIPVIETWDLPDNPVGHVVGFSNAAAVRSMVDHFVSVGITRIAFIGGDADNERPLLPEAADVEIDASDLNVAVDELKRKLIRQNFSLT